MQTKVLLAATAVLVTMLGVAPLSLDAGVGIRSAAAKDFYTRKRVKGRWVKGHFARHAARRDRAGSRRATAEAKEAARRAHALPEQDTPPSPDIQATSGLAATPLMADDRMRQLQQALEARAKAMARALPPSAAVSPAPSAPAPARSVTFDFESGVKTLFLSDGSVLEEPFDVATAHSLGILPPARAGASDPAGAPGATKAAQRR